MAVQRWMIGAVVVGGLLMLAGWAWPLASRALNPWTEEKARQHAQNAATVHQLAHRRIHAEADKAAARPNDAAESEQALQKAWEEYRVSDQALRAAKGEPRPAAVVMWWLGGVCIAAGAGGLAIRWALKM